jgi:phosphoenolpyruvate-protein kinase (PTS system EI component)
MMCGIPSITTALIDIDQFASLFDGFMLGSYDHNLLLRLRDDQKHCEIILPDIFDERNPIVFRHIELIIKSIRRKKKNVSICGDELSSSCPEMIDTLIRLGVDSLSVGVNNFMKTLLIVQRYEIVTLSDLNKVG